MGEDEDLNAAKWHSRLRTRSVGNAELAEFARWRRLPGNAEAYRRVEMLWQDAGQLGEDPDVIDALASAMRPRRRRTPMLALSVVAIAVMLVVFGPGLLQRSSDDRQYRTAVGERTSAGLADGSRISVDASSEVRVRLGSRERRIDMLRGQALFSVSHDAARPFVVVTPSGVTVTALGTKFDVDALPNGDVMVALLQGRVAVRRSDALLAELEPGETLLVSSDGRMRLQRGNARDSVDWTQGRLVFRSSSLRSAVEEVNRYVAVPVLISSPEAAGQTVSGEFSIDDPDGFVAAVNALIGPDTVRRGPAA